MAGRCSDLKGAYSVEWRGRSWRWMAIETAIIDDIARFLGLDRDILSRNTPPA